MVTSIENPRLRPVTTCFAFNAPFGSAWKDKITSQQLAFRKQLTVALMAPIFQQHLNLCLLLDPPEPR
jgi:hypothetical protein